MINGLKEDITAYLSKKKAHVKTGNRDGEESISFLLTTMKEKGYYNIDQRFDSFEDKLRSMGFVIRAEYRGRSHRQYVSVAQS